MAYATVRNQGKEELRLALRLLQRREDPQEEQNQREERSKVLGPMLREAERERDADKLWKERGVQAGPERTFKSNAEEAARKEKEAQEAAKTFIPAFVTWTAATVRTPGDATSTGTAEGMGPVSIGPMVKNQRAPETVAVAIWSAQTGEVKFEFRTANFPDGATGFIHEYY